MITIPFVLFEDRIRTGPGGVQKGGAICATAMKI
jgi:hypothetical protein